MFKCLLQQTIERFLRNASTPCKQAEVCKKNHYQLGSSAHLSPSTTYEMSDIQEHWQEAMHSITCHVCLSESNSGQNLTQQHKTHNLTPAVSLLYLFSTFQLHTQHRRALHAQRGYQVIQLECQYLRIKFKFENLNNGNTRWLGGPWSNLV